MYHFRFSQLVHVIKMQNLSPACSFSAFALHGLNVINLIILLYLVFNGFRRYGETYPQLAIANWR